MIRLHLILPLFIVLLLVCSGVAAQMSGGPSGSANGGSKSPASGNPSGGPSKNQSPSSPGGGGGNAPFESQMLSYAAIDKIAMDIVQEVCSRVKSGDTIVLYDATAFGDLLAYRTYVQQAMLVQAAYSGFNLAQPTVVQPKIGPTAAVAEIV